MKKVVYRDILGNNPRKREVSIEEINERLSDKVAKKWICKYFIKEMYTSSSAKELKHWIRTQQKSGVKKDSHILRKVDARTGENKIIYKVLGDIFVIS
ncbi:MAG: hypothetical protein HQ594_05100 [Candidatus Omnitrophica bacterium]|nr:hypothetical protein [Candidatus Omnitrophota bacterium]